MTITKPSDEFSSVRAKADRGQNKPHRRVRRLFEGCVLLLRSVRQTRTIDFFRDVGLQLRHPVRLFGLIRRMLAGERDDQAAAQEGKSGEAAVFVSGDRVFWHLSNGLVFTAPVLWIGKETLPPAKEAA